MENSLQEILHSLIPEHQHHGVLPAHYQFQKHLIQSHPQQQQQTQSMLNSFTNTFSRLDTSMKQRKKRLFVINEWFYSDIERPYFQAKNQDFQRELISVNFSKVEKLIPGQWLLIRTTMGTPRRLSPNFLGQERLKLESFREKVRTIQLEYEKQFHEFLNQDSSENEQNQKKPILKKPVLQHITVDGARVLIPRRPSVNTLVLARLPLNPSIFAPAKILAIEEQDYLVMFQDPALGIELVSDNFIMTIDQKNDPLFINDNFRLSAFFTRYLYGSNDDDIHRQLPQIVLSSQLTSQALSVDTGKASSLNYHALFPRSSQSGKPPRRRGPMLLSNDRTRSSRKKTEIVTTGKAFRTFSSNRLDKSSQIYDQKFVVQALCALEILLERKAENIDLLKKLERQCIILPKKIRESVIQTETSELESQLKETLVKYHALMKQIAHAQPLIQPLLSEIINALQLQFHISNQIPNSSSSLQSSEQKTEISESNTVKNPSISQLNDKLISNSSSNKPASPIPVIKLRPSHINHLNPDPVDFSWESKRKPKFEKNQLHFVSNITVVDPYAKGNANILPVSIITPPSQRKKLYPRPPTALYPSRVAAPPIPDTLSFNPLTSYYSTLGLKSRSSSFWPQFMKDNQLSSWIPPPVLDSSKQMIDKALSSLITSPLSKDNPLYISLIELFSLLFILPYSKSCLFPDNFASSLIDLAMIQIENRLHIYPQLDLTALRAAVKRLKSVVFKTVE